MTQPMLDRSHDATLVSWVASANGHPDFPIQNLPLGLFAPRGGEPRAGTAIGDRIVDLRALSRTGLLPGEFAALLANDSLNALLGVPSNVRRALRLRLSDLLCDPGVRPVVEPLVHAAEDCRLFVPARIGDYTDFYVGIHHANNIGRQYRPDNPLLPNYKHIPIGYHGRASSVCVSGTPVRRPMGQSKAADAPGPDFGPSTRLDHELEIGVWIGAGNALGTRIDIEQASAHIAGFCLLNDWSARDIQGWEAQPLGPFLAKSFQTSISPWIVTAEALAPFRNAQPARAKGDPWPLPHLWSDADQRNGALGVALEVTLRTAQMRASGAAPHVITRGSAANMYWTVAQLVAHHTSNGCNLNPGDLLGTGTISAPDREGFGSLMEISVGGTQPLVLPNGEVRRFLEDGDELTLTARASAAGYASIGFGQCSGVILPAQ